MMRTIESIRRKPKAVRNRYAFLMATLFTLVIAVIWGIGTAASLQTSLQGGTASVDGQAQAAGSFFHSVRDQVGAVISGAFPNTSHYEAVPATVSTAASTTPAPPSDRIVIGTTSYSMSAPARATTTQGTGTVLQ